MLKKLEEWGVGFEKDETGQYVGTPNFYGSYPGDKFTYSHGRPGSETASFPSEVAKRKITVIKSYNYDFTSF